MMRRKGGVEGSEGGGGGMGERKKLFIMFYSSYKMWKKKGWWNDRVVRCLENVQKEEQADVHSQFVCSHYQLKILGAKRANIK